MNTQYDLQLAYVLHSRAFRETSLLVELLTAEHGRVTVVARGAKRGKAKLSTLLQPFQPLKISWYGNNELVTLTQLEVAGPAINLISKRAICGLYVNELLYKLLNKWDPCTKLFDSYQQVLANLAQPQLCEQISLRAFEKAFLKTLGYGLQLTTEVASGAPIDANSYYKFDPVLGPSLVPAANLAAIKGTSLLALATDNYVADTMTDIKRLMRMVFAYHLGEKQLIARQLL